MTGGDRAYPVDRGAAVAAVAEGLGRHHDRSTRATSGSTTETGMQYGYGRLCTKIYQQKKRKHTGHAFRHLVFPPPFRICPQWQRHSLRFCTICILDVFARHVRPTLFTIDEKTRTEEKEQNRTHRALGRRRHGFFPSPLPPPPPSSFAILFGPWRFPHPQSGIRQQPCGAACRVKRKRKRKIWSALGPHSRALPPTKRDAVSHFRLPVRFYFDARQGMKMGEGNKSRRSSGHGCGWVGWLSGLFAHGVHAEKGVPPRSRRWCMRGGGGLRTCSPLGPGFGASARWVRFRVVFFLGGNSL